MTATTFNPPPKPSVPVPVPCSTCNGTGTEHGEILGRRWRYTCSECHGSKWVVPEAQA